MQGRRTLDCFCYVGAWALSAARFGAAEVIGLDSSEKAIALATENAALNGLAAQFKKADVFEELRVLEKQRERFGCIILDPPAFVKSRAKVREALKGYKEINLRAMKLLEPGGVLVTCSCSHHIDQELFREMLIDAAYSAGRQAKLLEMRSQARDHPALLAARETQYLKCAILINGLNQMFQHSMERIFTRRRDEREGSQRPWILGLHSRPVRFSSRPLRALRETLLVLSFWFRLVRIRYGEKRFSLTNQRSLC